MKKLVTQRDMELVIGKLLRYGVITACTITVLGGIIYLFQHQGTIPDYKAIPGHHDEFIGVAAYLRDISTIFPRMFRFDGAAIVQFGVIVLIATPVLRVLFSLIAFYIERDKLYVVISAIVLVIILCNMIFGLH